MRSVEREVREEIVELLLRYASAIDQRDWEMLGTCFAPDCQAQYGDFGIWYGADELVQYMKRAHEPFGATLHRITNQTVWSQGDGVAARSYVDAILVEASSGTGLRLIGYYDDDLVRAPEGWRIARRRFTPVLSERGIANRSLPPS